MDNWHKQHALSQVRDTDQHDTHTKQKGHIPSAVRQECVRGHSFHRLSLGTRAMASAPPPADITSSFPRRAFPRLDFAHKSVLIMTYARDPPSAPPAVRWTNEKASSRRQKKKKNCKQQLSPPPPLFIPTPLAVHKSLGRRILQMTFLEPLPPDWMEMQ